MLASGTFPSCCCQLNFNRAEMLTQNFSALLSSGIGTTATLSRCFTTQFHSTCYLFTDVIPHFWSAKDSHLLFSFFRFPNKSFYLLLISSYKQLYCSSFTFDQLLQAFILLFAPCSSAENVWLSEVLLSRTLHLIILVLKWLPQPGRHCWCAEHPWAYSGMTCVCCLCIWEK